MRPELPQALSLIPHASSTLEWLMNGRISNKTSSNKISQFCTFWVGSHLFGVNILDVKEVNTETTYTVIPHAPPEVRGYGNIRGQIFLVLDLHLLLGMERADVTQDSRLVIFKPHVGDAFGVLVDQVGDIIALDSEQIERDDQREEKRRGGDFLTGVGKLDGELLLLLEPRKFLKAIERALAV
jgi:chemotaxis signal transduction protein